MFRRIGFEYKRGPLLPEERFQRAGVPTGCRRAGRPRSMRTVPVRVRAARLRAQTEERVGSQQVLSLCRIFWEPKVIPCRVGEAAGGSASPWRKRVTQKSQVPVGGGCSAVSLGSGESSPNGSGSFASVRRLELPDLQVTCFLAEPVCALARSPGTHPVGRQLPVLHPAAPGRETSALNGTPCCCPRACAVPLRTFACFPHLFCFSVLPLPPQHCPRQPQLRRCSSMCLASASWLLRHNPRCPPAPARPRFPAFRRLLRPVADSELVGTLMAGEGIFYFKIQFKSPLENVDFSSEPRAVLG